MKTIFINILKIMFIAVALLFAANCAAQEDGYRIGYKDVLNLTIYAGGELQQQVEVTVNSRGEITVPFIGTMSVTGSTVQDVEAAISLPLSVDYFVDPEVIVQVTEYHSLRYFISGAVNSPGLYETKSRETLMTLIAKAGGMLPNRGKVAYILRNASEQVRGGAAVEEMLQKKEPIRVNLQQLLDQGNMAENIFLETGDVVYIPLEKERDVAESNIYVEGEVRSPGVYQYRPGLTALNACLMAGGFGKYAAIKKATIIRQRASRQMVIPINLEMVKSGKIPDVKLLPGDLINVPESWF